MQGTRLSCRFFNVLLRGFRQHAMRHTSTSSVIKPLKIMSTASREDIGVMLMGKLSSNRVNKVLREFTESLAIQRRCVDSGLDTKTREQALLSFSECCRQHSHLPAELHLVLHDIIHGFSTVDELFPLYLRHTMKVYPHIAKKAQLQLLGDMRRPDKWYPLARAIKRKVVVHVGPMGDPPNCPVWQRFEGASKAIYCGPNLQAATMAHENAIVQKVPCVLLSTYAHTEQAQASHVACTVQLAPLDNKYDVAVIDGMQYICDQQRGWAWTRAFLGLAAEEVHICGKTKALALLERLCAITGDSIEERIDGFEKSQVMIKGAGMLPTDELIEKFVNQLPNTPYSSVLSTFYSYCTIEPSLYFLCHSEKEYLAQLIDGLPLPLKLRQMFCSAPVSRKAPLACAMFVRFATKCATSSPITLQYVRELCSYEPRPASTPHDIAKLAATLTVIDLYIWFSFRLPTQFPDGEQARETQAEIEKLLEYGLPRMPPVERKITVPAARRFKMPKKAITVHEFRKD